MAIFARFLGPEDFGIVAYLAIIIAICDVFVGVAFSDVIVASKEIKADQLSTLYWINIATGCVVYGLLWFLAPLSSMFIDSPHVVDMVRLMSLTLIIGCTSVQFEAKSRKELRFRFLALVGILQSLVTFIVAIIFVTNGYGVWSIIYSALVAQAVGSVALVVYAGKNGWLPGVSFKYREVREYLRFGAFRIGAALLNNINSRSDQIAILTLLGPVQLGYYSLAYNIAMKPFQKINPILTQISFPIFAKVSTNRTQMLSGYRKGLRLLMLINAPLLLGYLAVAPLVVPVFLGPDWEPVILISQILAIYALFRSAANINIGLILANGKYRWPFYWNLFLFFLVPGCIFLVSKASESVIVVSYALALLQIALFTMGYVLFARKLLGPFGREFMRDLSGALSAALVMALSVIYLSSAFPISDPYLQLAVSILFGAMIYLVVSFLTQTEALQELKHVVIFRDKAPAINTD